MQNLKKIIYISSFTIFGVLLQFLAHELIEIWYIRLLVSDFERFGFGLPWGAWFLIHHAASAALFFVGMALGFWQGRYWWERIYKMN